MASLVPFPVTNWRVLQLFAFAAVFLCYQTLAEAPSKVSGITVTKVLSSRPALSVTWSEVIGSNITYNVCYSVEEGKPKVPPPGQSVCKAGITGPYFTLHPLSGGTTYYIWVRAESSGGQGPYSRRKKETTYNVIGWGNKSVEIVSYSHMLSLKWDGFGDFDYILYYQKTGTPEVPTVETTSLSYNITGLDSNTRYVVIVTARNDEIAAINEEMYPYTIPESPGPVTLTPLSSTSINVRWSPPPNSDRSPLTYHVNYTGMSRSTSNTTLTLTGLYPYEEYTISVQAGNEGGLSVPVTGKARTYRDIPTTPVVQTSTTTTSLYLQWTSSGGDTFTLYYWKNSTPSDVSTVTTTSLSYNITGLDSNTAYKVIVSAGNVLGFSNSSEVKGCTIPEAPDPDTPTTLSSTSINVRWSPPPNSDQLPLTYHVNYSSPLTGRNSTTAPNTTLTFTGLHPYEEYTISVQAGNEGGLSVPVTGTARTYSDRPSIQPTMRRSNPGRHWCVLQWKIPDETGRNGVIQKYIIELEQTEDNKWNITHELPTYDFSSPASISYNLTNLTPHTTYKWRVAAATVNGTGPFTPEPKEFTTSGDVPTTPVVQTTTTTTTTTSLYLQWTSSGGDTFTLYYWKTNTPSDVSTVNTMSLSYNITGLDSNTAYKVIVSARTSVGSANSSEALEYTIPEAPGPVTLTPLSSTSIIVRWSPPPNSDRSPLTYYVNYTGMSRSTSDTTLTLTGLHPYEEYTISVQAGNEGGLSVPVTGTARTYSDRIGPVSELMYNVTSESSVIISWSEPDEPNGVIVGYSVRYGEFEGNTKRGLPLSNDTSTDDTQITLEGLVKYIPYKATVSARTSVGEGEPSSVVFFTLEGDPTKPVDNVKVDLRGSDEVLVSWNPLSLAEARGFPFYIVSYTPSGCPGGGSVNTTTTSAVLTEVEPCISYVFSVQVTTGNGTNQGPTANVTVVAASPKVPEDNLTLYAVIGGAIAALLVILAAIVCVTAILIRRKRRLRKKPTSAICEVVMEKKDCGEYPMDQLGPEAGVPVCDKDAESIVDESLDEPSHERTIEKSRFIEVTDQLHHNRNHGFEEEYKTITNDPNGSDVIAKENRHKNRYINIYTYDHSRVTLSIPDTNGSDYINASYIHGFRRKNAYISTQGPTTNTIGDFWQMVWDQRSPVIVMLTKIEEKGKKKCERYWNEDVDASLEPGRDLSVRVTSIKGYANYVVREITLTNNSDAQSCTHQLKHFHYIAWPDYGVPAHPYSLVKFVQQVRKEYKDSTAPMVVHCSAGVGRTGTFITIDAMMERLKEKDDLNIYQFVTEMRSKRTFMVQTMVQYAFIHDALCDYLTCGDTSIPAYQLRGKIEDMENVDNDTRLSGFESQFKLLDSVSKKPASEDEAFSRKKIVEKKNRYKDRFPYYTNHLCVAGKGATSGGDYFNGTLLDSYSTNKAFIAAQAPLESTRNDVWEMIWQFSPSTIVLLCDFEEEKKTTCTPFWPDYHSKVIDFGFHQVNHKETTRRDASYDFITLDIFERGKEFGRVKELTIHHLKNWSKNRHPPLEVILRVMGDVERAMKSTPDKVFPAMVMCDDGMGRSGVFICAMSEVERVKVEGQVDVFQTIKGMRIQRPHMVDTPDQYKLCFDILQSYLDSFDAYANYKTV